MDGRTEAETIESRIAGWHEEIDYWRMEVPRRFLERPATDDGRLEEIDFLSVCVQKGICHIRRVPTAYRPEIAERIERQMHRIRTLAERPSRTTRQRPRGAISCSRHSPDWSR